MIAEFEIEVMRPDHWEQVRAIYLEGIQTGNATLEADAPEWEVWDSGHVASPRLVACREEMILGWAALSPVSGRCVYGGVAEVSIYIGEAYRGQGVGLALLHHLVQASETAGFWMLQAGILKENLASRQLHAKAGFREVGYRERLGKLNGVWRDVVLMERRSSLVGLE
ncbi:MAG: N-acetyltransferase [Chloroflexi bacterium]|nr:N-acetyltransferase [Chloroflexota bacterium]